jgi:hypothetical protein
VTSEERRAQNEALFRDLNERVKEIQDQFDGGLSAPTDLELLCECGELKCATRLDVTREEYEQARSDPTCFLVLPDHVNPQIETVVRETEGFAIVKKKLSASQIARDTDPRSR